MGDHSASSSPTLSPSSQATKPLAASAENNNADNSDELSHSEIWTLVDLEASADSAAAEFCSHQAADSYEPTSATSSASASHQALVWDDERLRIFLSDEPSDPVISKLYLRVSSR